jgi:long-chain acyl-CoA synthetase
MTAKKRMVKTEPGKVGSFEKPWYRFWPENVRKHIEYPEIPLSDFLRSAAKQSPNHQSLVYFDKAMTYQQLDVACDRFGTALSDLGVKKGDKVALFLPNIPQFVITYYGALRIGAVETAISPLYKEREVEHQLVDSEAETIVVLDALYPILEKAVEKTRVKRVVVTSL